MQRTDVYDMEIGLPTAVERDVTEALREHRVPEWLTTTARFEDVPDEWPVNFAFRSALQLQIEFKVQLAEAPQSVQDAIARYSHPSEGPMDDDLLLRFSIVVLFRQGRLEKLELVAVYSFSGPEGALFSSRRLYS